MKKTRLLWMCFLFIAIVCLLTVGCARNEKISSIALKDHDPSVAIEIPIGSFDYNAYTLVVNYDSGTTKEIAFSESMLAQTDIFKLYQEGEHNVTVSYGGTTYDFKISVKRGKMGDIKFPDNNVFTYDGNPHVVEIEGDIPANATVSYPAGNSFVNVGTYDVTAIVSCEGYLTERVMTTVKIERAKYDMENVRFEPKEVVYDGKSHLVKVSGTLPEGVPEPTYFINGIRTSGVVDAGEYKVKAVFASNDQNYEAIPDMETTLKINLAEYHIPKVDIVFKNEDGSAIDGKQRAYDSSSVVFDINDRSFLSNKVNVLFSVIDEDGTVISTSNKNTNIINVGVYTIKVDFILSDGKNYKPIEPMIHSFEITKASYDLSGVYFDSDVVKCDGELHKLTVVMPPELGINAEDVRYEYYLNGQLLQNAENGVVEAGVYTVKAIFTVNDENYEQIADMQATLIIEV